VNKHETKCTLLIVRHLLHVLFITLIENLRFCSSAEAEIALNLFLNYEQNGASCSYKIVLIKKISVLKLKHCLGLIF